MEYLIKQYALEPGAWEIQYIEEYFGEFPRRKTAAEIITRLRDRESLILIAEAPLPDDAAGAPMPVSYKIVHEIRADESVTKLRDLVSRLERAVTSTTAASCQWIGGTRRDWRGQGHFSRALPRNPVWAMGAGFEVVVKTKNRYYDMRAVLAQLHFNVVKHDPHATDSAESKVYLSKLLPAEVTRGHRSVRTSFTRITGPHGLTPQPQDKTSRPTPPSSVTTGSTCVPRRAGRYDATTATAVSIRPIATKVVGSFGPTWNSRPRSNRVAGIAASNPTASPSRQSASSGRRPWR